MLKFIYENVVHFCQYISYLKTILLKIKIEKENGKSHTKGLLEKEFDKLTQNFHNCTEVWSSQLWFYDVNLKGYKAYNLQRKVPIFTWNFSAASGVRSAKLMPPESKRFAVSGTL